MISVKVRRFLLLSFLYTAPLWVIFAVPATLNYSGYCWEEKRWLSDEEKIRRMIYITNKSGYIRIENKNKKGDYIQIKNIPYKDIDDFLQKNPDCCNVDSSYPYSSEGVLPLFDFWDYVFLGGGYVVHLNYLENYIDEDNIHQSHKVERQSVISNCGTKLRVTWELITNI